MALKTFNPVSAGLRELVIVDRSGLHKGDPKRIGGRHIGQGASGRGGERRGHGSGRRRRRGRGRRGLHDRRGRGRAARDDLGPGAAGLHHDHGAQGDREDREGDRDLDHRASARRRNPEVGRQTLPMRAIIGNPPTR